MTFETPAALWGLLSIVLLAIFSLWRQAAVRTEVPSLLLWKRLPERNPPIRALRRPRWRAELLLQALAIACAVAAIAGPSFATDRLNPRRVALVFDTSARMRAEDRLEKAKAEAARLLAGPLAGDDVATFAADPSPRRLKGPGEVRITDQHVDLAPLLAAARAHSEAVLLFSDRPADGAHNVLFGCAGRNAGIVELTASDDEVFARLVNHGPARTVTLRLATDGPSQEIRHTLPSGVSAWHRKGDFSKAASVTLEIAGPDHFPLDDHASASRLAQPRAVVSLTGHHPQLEAALRAIPGVVLRQGAGDALVAVGYDARPGPAALTVEIHPPAAPFTAALSLAGHPLLFDVKPEDFFPSPVGELPAEFRGGEALITAGGKSVAVLRGREIHLCVELLPDGWPKSPRFPIFWANVVDFSRKGAATFATVRTGRPFALPGDAVSVSPGGAATGEFVAATAGRYEIRTPQGSRWVEACLLDERESDTAGQTLALAWNPAAAAGREPVRRPLGGWAAGFALSFVALAWLLERRPD